MILFIVKKKNEGRWMCMPKNIRQLLDYQNSYSWWVELPENVQLP